MVEIQAEKKNEGMNQKSKNKFLSLFWLLTIGYLLLVANAELAFAAFNPQINYQGKLTTPLNVAVSDGTYHMRFYIYNTTGGATTSAIWTEDRSTAAGDRITVTNGLFSVMLGSSTPLTGVNFDQTLYLGIEVGGSSATPTWDGEMSPRKILGAVPAAFVAQNLNGGSATTTNLLVTSSTTLQNFTFQNATGTAATTTNLFSTNATFTNLFGTNSTITNSTTTNATSTNLALSGNLYTSLTQGSVPFIGGSGLLTQDNSNLFWDNSTKRLGIGINSPSTNLSLGSGAQNQKLLIYDDGGNTRYGFGIASSEMRGFFASDGHLSLGTISTGDGTTFSEKVRIENSGKVGIGIQSPAAALHVLSLSPSDQAVVEKWGYNNTSDQNSFNLSLKQVVTSGVVRWTFDILNDGTSYPDVLTFDRGKAGIGSTSPSVLFSVGGNGYFTGGLGIGRTNTAAGTLETSGNTGVGANLLIRTILNCNNAASTLQTDGSGQVVCGVVTAIGGTSAGGWTWVFPNQVQLATSSDYVLIGTSSTSPYAKLYVTASAATTTLALAAASNQTANILDIYDNNLALNSVITAGGLFGIASTSPWGLFSINPNRISGPSFVVGSSTKTDFIVTNAGNVGIGTTSPWKTFSVNGTVAFPGLETSTDNNDYQVVIKKTDGTLITDSTLLYNPGGDALSVGSVNPIVISAGAIRSSNASDLILTTAAFNPRGINISGTTGNMTMMTTGGNVGIGTSTPISVFDIFKANSDATAAFTSSSTAGVQFAWTVGSDLSDAGKFKISSSTVLGTNDRFVIDGAGNVGIGTADPGFLFDVQAVTAVSRIKSTTGTNSVTLRFDNTGGAAQVGLNSSTGGAFSTGGVAYSTFISSAGTNPIQFGTNDAAAMTIINGGNVGIGNTSPSTYVPAGVGLVVGSTTQTRNSLSILGNVTTNDNPFADLSFYNGTTRVGAIQGQRIGADTSGALYFYTATTGTLNLAQVIDRSGNVGIGTSTPYQKLSVAGNVIANTFIATSTATSTFTGGIETNLLNVTSQSATSTFANGISLAAGCFRMNSACLGSPGTIYPRWSDITDPNATLSLNMATFPTIFNWTTGSGANDLFRFTTDGSANGTGSLVFIQTGVGASVKPLRILSGSTEALAVDTSGNVGVGTTTPRGKIDILSANGPGNSAEPSFFGTLRILDSKGDTGENGGIEFKSSSSGSGYGWRITNPDIGGNFNNLYFQNRTNSSSWINTLTIRGSTGNVGIGTTSPLSILDIFKANGDATAAFTSSSTAGVQFAWTVGSDLSDGGKFKIASSTTLGTNDRFVIDGAGNVGIGTVSPGSLLSLYSPDTSAGATTILQLEKLSQANGDGPAITFTNNLGGQKAAKIYTILRNNDKAELVFARGDGADGYTESMTIDEDGNVGIGTISPGALLSLAPGASNTLVEAIRLNRIEDGNRYNSIYTESDDAGDAKIQLRLHDGVTATSQAIVMTLKGNGNVGIGTVSPDERLHILNDGASPSLVLEESGALANSSAYIQFQDSAGTAYVQTGFQRETSDFKIQTTGTMSNAGFAASSDFVVDDGGNVGIGTTTPGAKLGVYGNEMATVASSGTATNAISRVLADNGITLDIGALSTSPYGNYLQSTDRTNLALTYPLLLNPNGGNVGIGTTSPATKLDVAGGIRATLSAIGANTGQLVLMKSDGTLTTDTTQLTWDSAGDTMSVNGLTIGANTIRANGSGNLTLTNDNLSPVAITMQGSTGNVGIGTTTPGTVNGTALTAGRALHVSGTNTGLVIVDGTGRGALDLNDSGATANSRLFQLRSDDGLFQLVSWNDNETEKSVILNATAAGNVGIGTVSPTTKFSINDSASTNIAEKGIFMRNDATNDYINIWNYGTNVYAIESADESGYRDLSLQPHGGNVGIGTTSPGKKLEVYASTEGDLLPLQVYGKYLGNSTPSAGLGIDLASTYWGTSLYHAGNRAFTVESNYGILVGSGYQSSDAPNNGAIIEGNVGIGTASPNSKLQINKTASDTISIANSDFYFADVPLGAGLMGQQLLSSPYSFVLQNVNPTDNNWFPLSLNPVGGNVGIGTTNPGSKLHIEGASAGSVTESIRNTQAGTGAIASLRIGNDLAVNRLEVFTLSSTYTGAGIYQPDGSSITNEGTGGLGIGGTGASGVLRFYTGGTGDANERMRILSGGNVGIGTTTPFVKLTVSGSAYIAGDITATGTVRGLLPFNYLTTPEQSPSINMSTFSTLLNWTTGTASNDLFRLATDNASNGTGYLLFVGPGNASSVKPLHVMAGNTEAIAVDTNGFTGFGTTTPNNKIDIYSTTKAALGFSGAPDSTYKWTIGMDVTNAGRFSIASSTVLGTTDRLVIDGAGKVGIGVSAPNAVLDVRGVASGARALSVFGFDSFEKFAVFADGKTGISNTGTLAATSLFQLDTTGTGYVMRINRDATSSGGHTVYATGGSDSWLMGLRSISDEDFHYYNYALANDAITIKNTTGNVGIGTTSPMAKLAVAGGINIGSGVSVGDLSTDDATKPMSFSIGSSEKVRISTAGFVGVGSTSPSTALVVVGTSTLDNIVPSTSASFTEATTSNATTLSVGAWTDVAIGTDGLPVIAYYDGAGVSIKVAKCGNSNCSSGNTVSTVDTVNAGSSQGISIAIGTADGFPVISYYNSAFPPRRLIVAHCGNASCSSGNATTTLDIGGGQYSSIAIGTDGFPVISYYDLGNADLKVAHCGNASCSSGNATTTVDSAGNYGQYSSIAIGTDGFPIISHWDSPNASLRFTHCGNASCSSGNASGVLDNAGVSGYTSIAIGADGFPVISYRGTSGATALKVARCGNASCSSGNATTTVDESATINVGSYTSIAIGPSGIPVISYYDDTNSNLKVARCGNASCSSGNVIATPDSIDNTGNYTSIAFNSNGAYVISYMNLTTSLLKVYVSSFVSGGYAIGSLRQFFSSLWVGSAYVKGATVSGFDIAENYQSMDILSPGEIVSADPAHEGYVKRAGEGSVLLGVVSTKPGITLADWNDSGGYPIALGGRVPVKVSTSTGDINIGDRIALSSTPGVGRKAIGDEPSVGISLGSFSSEGVGVVETFIDLKGKEGNTATTTLVSNLLNVFAVGTSTVAKFTNDTGTCSINPTATALSCSSDVRLKENINTIASSTDIVRKLRGVTFNWKNDNSSTTRIGFIAQEVQTIAPELVSEGPDGYLSVNYLNFAPILVNAWNALDVRVTSLESIATSTLPATSTPMLAVTEAGFGIGTLEPIFALHAKLDPLGHSMSKSVAVFENSNGVCEINPSTGSFGCAPNAGVTVATSTIGTSLASSTDIIRKLHGVNLSLMSASTTVNQFGFLADDVAAIAPELVDDVGGIKLVRTTDIIPLLVNSVNDLAQKVESLDERVAKLEALASTTASVATTTATTTSNVATDDTTDAQFIIGAIISAFQNMGTQIGGGFARFTNVFADQIVIGSQEKPAGITLYDIATRQPYCVRIENGSQVTMPGTCAETLFVSSSELPPETPSDTSVTIAENAATTTATTTAASENTTTTETTATTTPTETSTTISSESEATTTQTTADSGGDNTVSSTASSTPTG